MRRQKTIPTVGPLNGGHVLQILPKGKSGKTKVRFECGWCGEVSEPRWTDLVATPRWDPARGVFRRPTRSCGCLKIAAARANLEHMVKSVPRQVRIAMWGAYWRKHSFTQIAADFRQPLIVAKVVVMRTNREFRVLRGFLRAHPKWYQRAWALNGRLLRNRGEMPPLRRVKGWRPRRRRFGEFTEREMRSWDVKIAREIHVRFRHLSGSGVAPLDVRLHTAALTVEKADATARKREVRNASFRKWWRSVRQEQANWFNAQWADAWEERAEDSLTLG